MTRSFILQPAWNRRRKTAKRKRRSRYYRRYRDSDRPPWAIILRARIEALYGGVNDRQLLQAAEKIATDSGAPGLAISTVAKWMRGLAAPGPKYYRGLALLMDITVEQLYDYLWPYPGGPYEGPVVTGQTTTPIARLGPDGGKAAQVVVG